MMLEKPYCIRYAKTLAAEDSFVLAISTTTPLVAFTKSKEQHCRDEYIVHRGSFWLYLPTTYPNYPWSGTKPHDNLESFEIKDTV